MNDSTPIAVTSRSFSRHAVLRNELSERYSNVRFNDEGRSLRGNDLIEFARGRQKLITALETIDLEFLEASPQLEVISKYGVGIDMLDLAAMARHGVRLGWTGGVNRRSVSELTIAFMISLLRRVPQCSRDTRDGIWQNHTGVYLSTRTVGIIGCGHIGKDLVGLLNAFGCRVLVNDIRDYAEFYAEAGVEPMALDDLLRESDVVSLHVPLDDSTRRILSAERLGMMKPGAFLVNTARGGLVDEEAVKLALMEGRLAGAAFDVFDAEPPQDAELLRHPNFLCTPHIGGSAEEAILAMGRAAIDGLDQHGLPTAEYVRDR